MAGPAERFRAWLGRHPILFVALLSPGIVEYLSGSSAFSGLVLDPPLFLLLLAANLGLYVPGVLLIREAKLRWGGGWGTVFLLGTAYAFVEEGLALSTMFDPRAGVVGALGSYGHFAGVNWAWIPGVIAVHVVFSISLPILLLDLALPGTRGRPLLTGRGIAIALGVLAATTATLMVVVARLLHFFMGVPLVLATLAVIATLVAAAAFGSAPWIGPLRESPTRSPAALAVLGFVFWPALLVYEAIAIDAGAPPYAMVAGFGALVAGFALVVLRGIGRTGNERQQVALAAGLVAPLMIAGLAAQIRVPVVAFADLAAIWFFAYLWSRHAPARAEPPTVPAAASLGTRPGRL